MPTINVLPKQIAEKIAAGEVVERPASVIKEIIENAIDAGATDIIVEIKGGGILFMRVTDNGCGIKRNEVPTAFLRHATSKIVKENDLDSINTLGFRGEALAAISSVSKVEMITRTEFDDIGTRYQINGGEEVAFEEAGCPVGTTITVRDLFYNTPARMKFLQKDFTEANAIGDLVEKIALSHPEISFKFIKDGKQTITTTGDGKLKSAIYSVLGREFTSTLIETNIENCGVSVEGFVCKPIYCRPKRNAQYFFLNGRIVRNSTMVAALEAAYKNSAMVGKFPACVLNLYVNPETVDVNVHPTKTKVRFSDDKRIFNAVYYAVKNALESFDERPQISVAAPQNFKFFEQVEENNYKQDTISQASQINDYKEEKLEFNIERPINNLVFHSPLSTDNIIENTPQTNNDISKIPDIKTEEKLEKIIETKKNSQSIIPDIKFVGEAFSTYIIVEKENSVFFIDKHASHERILFEKLKKNEKLECQQLLLPRTIKLPADQYKAILEAFELLEKSGFEIEDFGNNTVIIRGIPSSLSGEDVSDIIYELAENLSVSGKVEIEKLEDIYHTVACKAAIKAGFKTSNEELLRLANEVLSRDDIFYCPHGRPVAFELKKKDLEKQFGRIQ